MARRAGAAQLEASAGRAVLLFVVLFWRMAIPLFICNACAEQVYVLSFALQGRECSRFFDVL